MEAYRLFSERVLSAFVQTDQSVSARVEEKSRKRQE